MDNKELINLILAKDLLSRHLKLNSKSSKNALK